MDELDDPHRIRGEVHAMIAVLLAITDGLPPQARPLFGKALEAHSQKIRDLFGDLAFRDGYFAAYDAVVDRFRVEGTRRASAPPQE